jgi:glutamate synthase domain-containing protein 2
LRRAFVIFSIVVVATLSLCGYYFSSIACWIILGILSPVILLGYYDYFQRKHTLMSNFPVLGRFRWLFEDLRPKLYQYFVESDIDGTPINRIDRSTVYQRSKKVIDTIPFGTQLDVYKEGYEWMMHSINSFNFEEIDISPRILIGNKGCTQPYSCSVLNVSAMSFGALSHAAVTALNKGAQIGGFAQNTGEGGISPYHLSGGDIIWQIGTGYFGARDEHGNFSAETYRKNALRPEVKMIELKLSQGAKPGHGGILPASKNSEEIAAIRHVKPHTKVASPPHHSAFHTPKEMIQFIDLLRKESGGKPVGFKLAVGVKREFMAICKAMIELDIYPDYIAVDGGEGGTGAAPQEFSNYVGAPFLDALAFVDNMLTGFGIREHIKIIGSGKVMNGFGMMRAMALGADAIYSARGMMLSIGCIQALLCNTNTCPTGIATQDPQLVAGLDPTLKSVRAANYHSETVKAYAELLAASGLRSGEEVTRNLIYRRTSASSSLSYDEIYPSLTPGCFIKEGIPYPEKYRLDVQNADPNRW